MRHQETREGKAERLVRDGCVGIDLIHTGYAWAHVQGDRGTYWTQILPDGTFFCNCEYGLYHNGSDDRCSHALALALVVGEASR